MALRYVTALVGAAPALVCLAGAPARVEAKPYPVRIESQPSGATVYLDSKEGDPLGQTPYSGRLAAGSHTLIIELDGYVSQVQDITIHRHHRVQRIAVRLSKIDLASIEVTANRERRGSDATGARILVDGKELGKLPATIKVPAGPHQVEVVKDGYKTFETWIEAGEGEKLAVAADMVPLAGAGRVAAKGGGRAQPDPADDPEEPPTRVAAAETGGEGDRGDQPEGLVAEEKKPVELERQAPFFSIGAGFELGGRRYRADENSTQSLREYDAGAVPIVRLSVELNPLAFATSKWVSGWGFYGGYARATPLDSAARLQSGEEVDVPTTWTELDLGLRFRYRFRPGTHIGLEGGYGKHAFGFDFSDQTEELAAQVPDVDYEFWRLGVEGRYSFGMLAALGSAGTRMVNSIGELGDRFAKTDVIALGGTIGMAATLTRSIEAQLVGRYDRYSHEYTAMTQGELAATSSGLDQFFGVTLSAFFVY
ncbi:MAG TPA: PEGA domain-containing protein [Kofleriaceae bacterium]|nr:PEGA domain-containing protein [Kofleriaceae bacterium]